LKVFERFGAILVFFFFSEKHGRTDGDEAPGLSGKAEVQMVHLALHKLSLEPEDFEEKKPLLSL
jgi:hypothetical protein